MQFLPIHDRLLVRPSKAEEKTSGGILLPETAQERPHRGEVLAAGPGKFEDGIVVPMLVKQGDTVLYGKYSGTEVTLQDGSSALIMREGDIFAIITD